MRLRSFRARLVAGTAVWTLLALVAAGMVLSLAFRRAVEIAFDDRLQSLLIAVIAALDVPPDGPAVMTRTIPEPRFERAYSGWYWQVSDADHHLRSRSLWDHVMEAGAADAGSLRGPRGEPLRVRERSLQFPSRELPIRVAVAAPQAELQLEIDGFDRLLLAALTILGVGLAIAIGVQVAYGLRPLRRLADELQDVRSGRAERLGEDYPREVEPLVGAMNDVLGHQRQLIERARSHVGDLAHALKTPLSVLAADASRGGMDVAAVKDQLGVMARLVDHHLTRAAAAGAKRVPGARTDVGDVVENLRRTLLRLHAGRGLSIDVAISNGLIFAGEREDLEEILGNLMDNACKWAAARVGVRANEVGHRLHLQIDDDGPGLKSEAARRAIERGTRFDPTTPGSGLGLSIAADLIDLYGGSLTLDRADLGGLIVRLELPTSS